MYLAAHCALSSRCWVGAFRRRINPYWPTRTQGNAHKPCPTANEKLCKRHRHVAFEDHATKAAHAKRLQGAAVRPALLERCAHSRVSPVPFQSPAGVALVDPDQMHGRSIIREAMRRPLSFKVHGLIIETQCAASPRASPSVTSLTDAIPMRSRVQTVLGHRIPEPRVTARAYWLFTLLVVTPVFLVGTAADLTVQWVFGVCTGLWCL